MADQSNARVTALNYSNCGEPFPLELVSSQDKLPCARCGSTARHVTVTVEDSITLHERLGWETNDPNLASRKKQKKTRVEGSTGSEWSARFQKMVHKERLIDRKNNRYEELVTDRETGDVIHEVNEPLSQHIGHGSAKTPNASDKEASEGSQCSNPGSTLLPIFRQLRPEYAPREFGKGATSASWTG